VFKIAKLYQPSVIFIDDASSIFAKKVLDISCKLDIIKAFMLRDLQGKDDPYDSTRMKKELPKALKALNPGLQDFTRLFHARTAS
jgi:hypothetical protein